MSKKIEEPLHRFDRKSCRHTLDGATSVLHCHHFATLYSQLADDAEFADGRALLSRSAELAFHPVLARLIADRGLTETEDRIAAVEEHFRFCGMGTLRFEQLGSISSVARMDHSHVDEGWIKKWGNREKPVNYIGQGYIAAALAAVHGLPLGSFKVSETESIVAGAKSSRFHAVRA
jgi:hypothetical protein